MTSPPLRAVIDLGTNTFHLLIAKVLSDDTIQEVYRERCFVKLASEGIQSIGEAPFERGIKALRQFREILNEYKCTEVLAIGTEALRRAKNGKDFITAAQREAEIVIRLITGDEEAALITRGVLAALPVIQERLLIMDIGGGSTEYIIVEGQQVLWRQSFPLGVSVLYDGFHHSEPITPAEQNALRQHLEETTRPLAAALRRFPTHHLTGAAGTFDVLIDLLRDEDADAYPTSQPLNFERFPDFLHQVLKAGPEERLLIPGLPAQRVDMIVVAMLLLDFTIKLADIDRVTVSQYAMKEGILLNPAYATSTTTATRRYPEK